MTDWPLRNAGNLGRFNPAGLPNITGTAGIGGNMGSSYELCIMGSSGALNANGDKGIHSYSSTSADNTYGGLSFNASAASPYYGASSTVMPDSADLFMAIYLGCPAEV